MHGSAAPVINNPRTLWRVMYRQWRLNRHEFQAHVLHLCMDIAFCAYGRPAKRCSLYLRKGAARP